MQMMKENCCRGYLGRTFEHPGINYGVSPNILLAGIEA